jgi:hypothetical protein
MVGPRHNEAQQPPPEPGAKTTIPSLSFAQPHYPRAWKMGYTSDSSVGPLGDCSTKEPKVSLGHLTCAAAVRPT